MATAAASSFSLADAHALVRDLLRPDLRRYWADMLASALAGWTAIAALAVLLARGGTLTWWALAVYPVAVLVLYRAVVFLHEIVHHRGRRGFAALRVGWNLLVGVPVLVPAFMYEVHSEHHSKRVYGTARDGEYLPFARLPRADLLRYVAMIPVLPLLGLYRFGVLAPVSWLVPSTRAWVWTRASSVVLDMEYTARAPKPGPQLRSWRAQEVATAAFLWGSGALAVAGVMPWQLLVSWFAVMAGTTTLDAVRTLGAHRYIGDDDAMTVVEQMLDTVNYPRRPWLSELWGPVGLRLHALHHLLPALPYHAMPEAHRRLVSALPEDSAYRLTESPGLLVSLVELWRTAGGNTGAASEPPVEDHAGVPAPVA